MNPPESLPASHDRMEHLARIHLFEGVPPDLLKSLGEIIVDQHFSKGRHIFSEGDEGAGFYVVISGRVKVFKVSLEGKEQILHIFGPGEPFGEVPVFSGEHFPANAEALEESRIFFFPRAAFVGLIKKNPDVALKMLAVLSKRLRRFAALIEDLSLKEVPGRLAVYLLYLSDRRQGGQDLLLDISKAQLAAWLGTIPETLSRILRRMSDAGLIETEGRKIRILDREALMQVVDSGGRLGNGGKELGSWS